MNKSKIEWCDYTWNPVTGCLHGCEFCYARRINKRFGDGKFIPTFHRERLNEPLSLKKPSRIFVGSMSDLFGNWGWAVGTWEYSPAEVILEILEVVKQCPQHTFIFLTKNPKGMQGIDFPSNCWCGTSVENQEKADDRLLKLLGVRCKTLFVSIEPILGPVEIFKYLSSKPPMCLYQGIGKPPIGFKGIDWVIIGAQTGPGAIKPEYSWVNSIAEQCEMAEVPLFIKDNAADYYHGELLPRQYPQEATEDAN